MEATCFVPLNPLLIQAPCTHSLRHLQTPRQSRIPPHISRCVLYTSPTPSIARATPLSPVIILPGLGNSSSDYAALALQLLSRGHAAVSVVPVARWKWSLNARSLFTRDYWRGTLRPGPVLDWYFTLVDESLAEVQTAAPGVPVSVLGHSAGGWLARVYVAERLGKRVAVAALVTLGTPHQSPPRGRMDQTRGLLEYVERECEVEGKVGRFVCVAGKGVVGKPWGTGTGGEWVAFKSYEAVCGEGGVDGDGVTPVQAACAEGGSLVVCENCLHSMLTGERWYGSGKAFEKWVQFLP